MALDQRWKKKAEEKLLLEEEKRGEKLLPFNLMKSKIVCLSKNTDFKDILKGKKSSNKYFTIFYKKLINSKNKLNISFVTKKKLGNAVKRNKIKRRLRNIMDYCFKKISIKLNYSYLVIAKPTMLNNEFKDIKEILFREFSNIK